MEQEKTDAKNDEKLMRQKLEFVTKEKEVLLQKIRNLEGMYQSEIGDVKNVEELMQRIKKVELESEYAKKSENNAKRESAELKMILQGLKDQITQIENQRDHYEDKFLHAEDELRRRMESEAEFQQNHRNSLETKEELLQEISRIKFRYDSILREKGMLDEENRELQERLSDNMDRIMMSSEKKNTNGVGDNRWTDLGEVLRRSGFIEVPLDYQPDALIDCVQQLIECIEDERAHIGELENQVVELRQAKIDLLQKLDTDVSIASINIDAPQIEKHNHSVKAQPPINSGLEEKISLYEQEISDNKSYIQQLENKISQTDDHIAHLNNKLSSLNAEHNQMRQVSNSSMNNQSLDIVKKNLDNAKNDNESLRKENQQFKSDLSILRKSEEEKNNELVAYKQDNSKLVQEILSLKNQIDSLRKESNKITDLKRENADLRSKSENLVKQIVSQMANSNTSGVETEKLKLENGLLKNNIETLKKELLNSQGIIFGAQKEIERQKDNVVNLEKQLEQSQKLSETQKNKIGDLEGVCENNAEEILKLNSEIGILREKLNNSQTTIQSQTGHIAGIESENIRFKEENNRLNDRLEKLTKEHENKDAASVETYTAMEGLRLEVRQLEEANRNLITQIDSVKGQLIEVGNSNEDMKNQIELLSNEDKERRTHLASLQHDLRQKTILEHSLNDQVKNLTEMVNQAKEKMLGLENDLEVERNSSERAVHEREMIELESEGIKSELERVKKVLDSLVDKEKNASANSRNTSLNIKMLDEQVKILNDENLKLKEEKQTMILSIDRLKNIDIQSKQIKEENFLLKGKNDQLRIEMEKLNASQSKNNLGNDQIISKLREEIRELKEKEIRMSLNPAGSRMNHQVTSNREVQILEQSLAKAENEIRTQNARIRELEENVRSKTDPNSQKEHANTLHTKLIEKDKQISDLRTKVEILESIKSARGGRNNE